MWFLAQQSDLSVRDEVTSGYGGLIFMGVFFLVLLGLAIWWLKRST
jgi:hypothetical protein